MVDGVTYRWGTALIRSSRHLSNQVNNGATARLGR